MLLLKCYGVRVRVRVNPNTTLTLTLCVQIGRWIMPLSLHRFSAKRCLTVVWGGSLMGVG